MVTPKNAVHIRLPPDILARIDQGIDAGLWGSRTDFLYRASLFYLERNSLIQDARLEFDRLFHSEEFKSFIRTLVNEEKKSVLGTSDKK